MLKISILFLIYAVIFMIPTSLAGKRRRSGLPAYWWLLLISLALELIVVYIGLGLLDYMLIKELFFLCLPPILAGILAGIFYYKFSKQLDNRIK